MRWNELTAKEIIAARETTGGVCLLPFGVIERHGDHLPTGIDYMKAGHFADMAAELEPAMVFPEYYVGNVVNVAFSPGTISFPVKLALDMLETVCSEISRNGFNKIILINAHGGNIRLIDLFLDMLTEKPRDFLVYFFQSHHFGERAEAALKRMYESTGTGNGHAGGYETAVALRLFPEFVKLDAMLPPEASRMRERAAHLKAHGLKIPYSWFMKFPNHVAAHGANVTSEDGAAICEAIATDIAAAIRAVRNDDDSAAVQEEFHRIKDAGGVPPIRRDTRSSGHNF